MKNLTFLHEKINQQTNIFSFCLSLSLSFLFFFSLSLAHQFFPDPKRKYEPNRILLCGI